MKKLSEKDLLSRLYAKREVLDVTYEEISNPDYATWGRARAWQLHQATCLLAGLAPICREYFDLIIHTHSTMSGMDWWKYYPISQTDSNRLHNVYYLLKELPWSKPSSRECASLSPQALIHHCKNASFLNPSPSPDLIHVVDTFGPHPSMNLPEVFSSLEINPGILQTIQKFLAKSSRLCEMQVCREIPLPQESPIEIARRLFPLQNIEKWNKATMLTPCEVVLLHYEIEPADVLTHARFVPLHPLAENVEELLHYIAVFLHADRNQFVLQIDSSHLWDLLRRAIAANTLKLAVELVPPFYCSGFVKNEIIQWMQFHDFSFPLSLSKSDGFQNKKQIAKEDLLNYDLRRLKEDQLARMVVRCIAAALWKRDPARKQSKILHDTLFHKLTSDFFSSLGREDGYAEESLRNWIRDLDPHYKPRGKSVS